MTGESKASSELLLSNVQNLIQAVQHVLRAAEAACVKVSPSRNQSWNYLGGKGCSKTPQPGFEQLQGWGSHSLSVPGKGFSLKVIAKQQFHTVGASHPGFSMGSGCCGTPAGANTPFYSQKPNS